MMRDLGLRLRLFVLQAAALVASWQYPSARRDLRFDFLRGFAVFAMVVDHIGGDVSALYAITGGNSFFVSAAEAFVFISGLVMGIVYRGVIARSGLVSAVGKALRRAWMLYVLTVALTLSYALLAYGLALWWSPQINRTTIDDYLLGILTLHRTGYLTDVLLLYTLVVAAAALVLVALVRGYTFGVLAASWGLWALWQVWPEQVMVPWTIVDNGVFSFPAWQVLFFTGLVMGFHRAALAVRLGRIPPTALLLGSGALVAGTILLRSAGLVDESAPLASELLAKSDVGLGRLVAFAVFATFAFMLVSRFWGPLYRGLGWLLMPLGEQALLAYVLHLLVVAGTTRLSIDLALARSPDENLGLQVAGVLLVWGLVVAKPVATARFAGWRRQLQQGPLAPSWLWSHS